MKAVQSIGFSERTAELETVSTYFCSIKVLWLGAMAHHVIRGIVKVFELNTYEYLLLGIYRTEISH